MGDNNFDWLDSTGSNKFKIDGKKVLDDGLQLKINAFLQDVQSGIQRYKVISSGKLSREIKVKKTSSGSLTLVEFYMIYYGLFQNYGVKGWHSKKNAPNSPYSFKSKGMSEDGRKKIEQGIKNGRYKVRNATSGKKGLEEKANSKGTLELATQQAVWNIKKYGIKAKPFWTEAYEKHFGKFDKAMIEALGKHILAQLAQ